MLRLTTEEGTHRFSPDFGKWLAI